MSVGKIKQYLIDNPHEIEHLLEEIGFHHISQRNGEYRCALDYDSNPTSIRVMPESLASSCFSRNIKGDLISLIQWRLGLSFPETLKYINNVLGLDDSDYEYVPPKQIFGGFFQQFKPDNRQPIPIIDESEINQFEKLSNRQFLDDGISLHTQDRFGLRYCFESDRIIIPYHDMAGNLVGAIGRANYNKPSCKYLAMLPFPKRETLYGYSQNYADIQNNDIVLIGESEKFVMQLHSMGLNIGLGLGGNSISETQTDGIQSLGVSKIIVALDEDRSYIHIKNQAEKLLIDSPFVNSKVGFIYDKQRIYLPLGSKYAPTDLGIDVLKNLINDCVYWLN